MEKKLDGIFYTYDTSAGLSGNKNLIYKEYKRLYPDDREISISKVQNYLNLQEIYSLHRNARKKIPRNPVYAGKMGFLVAADLIDFNDYKEYNDGMRYILVVIDCFSKMGYAEPLKLKTGEQTLAAFQKILARLPEKPSAICVDYGTEFWNKTFQNFMKENSIHLYGVSGMAKNSIAERFIRTIKTKIYRVFDRNRDRLWLNILPKIISGYNHTFHSTICMPPNQVTKFNEDEVYQTLYPISKSKIKPKLKKGDMVRISLSRGPFAKSFEQTWSRALYKITSDPYYPRKGYLPMYKLEETDGEKILGGFYEYELQFVDRKKFYDDFEFPVEKVLKKRGNKSFVKFLGYPDRMNAWVTL